jgi:hypothetical protein
MVVFVLDGSASMRIPDAGTTSEPRTRIRAATAEIRKTLEGLRQSGTFLFDIVVCASRIDVLSEHLGRPGPLRLDARTEKAAAAFLSGRRGTGMTRMFGALQRAFRICGRGETPGRAGSVFLYTDGIPTFSRASAGPRSVEDFFPAVREANARGVRINAYAVSATSEGANLLRRLCRENGGVLFLP